MNMKDKRIDEITVEGSYNGEKEGYVYLNKGYRLGDTGKPNDQQHGFGYLGQAEIRARMKQVVPCSCAYCRGEER